MFLCGLAWHLGCAFVIPINSSGRDVCVCLAVTQLKAKLRRLRLSLKAIYFYLFSLGDLGRVQIRNRPPGDGFLHTTWQYQSNYWTADTAIVRLKKKWTKECGHLKKSDMWLFFFSLQKYPRNLPALLWLILLAAVAHCSTWHCIYQNLPEQTGIAMQEEWV